ncbi:hypothetical protein N7508_002240, partial [Penicillium antarcticum]|uniref:uncharacterized protein n=1 Tax=Penicillium antarcticum TaxID=416450 RepID=UPI00239BFB02
LSKKRNFCGKLGHLKRCLTQHGGPSSFRSIEKKIPPLSPLSQNEAPIPPKCILWYVFSHLRSARIASSIPESVSNFNEQYTLDAQGKRVYTLKKVLSGEVTKSAHPARFSPDDKYSRHRVTLKKRYGLLLTQQSGTSNLPSNCTS